MIFDRDASGNTKPLRVIRGPKTGGFGGGQIAIYPEKGWILIELGGSIGRSGTSTMKETLLPAGKSPLRDSTGGGQNSGIAIIPKAKEIMIASARQNRVLTFYFPEMFE